MPILMDQRKTIVTKKSNEIYVLIDLPTLKSGDYLFFTILARVSGLLKTEGIIF